MMPAINSVSIENFRVFNDDGKTKVQARVQMPQNLEANPFEITKQFRTLLEAEPPLIQCTQLRHIV